MDYNKTALEILNKVGGKSNVKNVLHCATRLRIEIADKSILDIEQLEKIEGVHGVVDRSGQLQFILGQGIVDEVYREFLSELGEEVLDDNVETEKVTDKKKLKLLDLFLETVSSIFAPIIPAIVGSGMIMGLLYSGQVLGIVDPENGLIQLLNIFSNAAFYFLPMYLAFSSAQRFKCNPYVAAVLGAVLIHPTIIEMVNAGNATISLGFIKIVLQNYSSSVVPIIITIYFMSLVEKGLKKIVPKMIDIIVTPTLTIVITGIIALWILAPLGQFAGVLLADAIVFIHDKASWLAGLVLGLFYPFILATGMQVGMTPIIVMNLENLGYDFTYPFIAASNAAMAAGALYIMVKTKDKNLKGVASSTGISALIGVTEPVLYGLVLRFKKLLFAVMIGGGVGGLIMGIFKVQYMGFGFVPFGTIMLAFGDTFIYYLIGVAVSMIITVLILIYKGYEEE